MLTMRVDHLAAQIVRHELLGKGRKDEALYLNFDIGLSYFNSRLNTGIQPSERRGLHLLYHSLPHGSVVTVFSGVTTSPFHRIEDVDAWKHETSHDSGWRDIQTFSRLYFEMADSINRTLHKRGSSLSVAPKDMHENNSFRPMSNHLFEWVKVKVSYDETDDNHYRRVVSFE